MPPVVQIATPARFRQGRIEKVGFRNARLYVVLVAGETDLEVWELHSQIPNSWRQIFSIKLLELCYFYFTLSNDSVYGLVLAVFVRDKTSR